VGVGLFLPGGNRNLIIYEFCYFCANLVGATYAFCGSPSDNFTYIIDMIKMKYD
jgi:hypothetical protein